MEITVGSLWQVVNITRGVVRLNPGLQKWSHDDYYLGLIKPSEYFLIVKSHSLNVTSHSISWRYVVLTTDKQICEVSADAIEKCAVKLCNS